MIPTPDIGQLKLVLAELGLGEPVSVVEMSGGSSPAFRIDLAGGDPVVLKTYSDLAQKLPTREAYASRLLGDAGIPVTRYLALDETRAKLSYRFALTNYLPGVNVGSLKGQSDAADAYRQMGALLKQIHAVWMPAFGAFDENGIVDPKSTNAAYLRGLADHAFDRFLHYGADPDLARQLSELFYARFDTIAQSTGPVFAHQDFHPNNVLARRGADGRLMVTGVIDFGNACAADPVFDLAKTLFVCEHEAPGSTPEILAGYGAIDHPHPQAALWFYTLLHRVIMWWWLRHVGIIADHEPDPLMADLRKMAGN